MKQYITSKQLQEFDIIKYDKELLDIKNNYIQWADANGLNDPSMELFYEDMSQFITIGKMIEIISKFVYDIEIFIGHGYWNTKVKITGDNGEKEYKSEWLCDALWECVKDILNERGI